MSGPGHPGRERLARLAAGAAPSPAEARHLLGCPACRARLAGSPDTLLAVLGALPAPPPPPLPALPPRRASRTVPVLLAAAALLLAAFLGALRGPGPGEEGPAPGSLPGTVVTGGGTVEAPGARVVTWVPRDPAAPVVTLVLDQEFDL